MTRLMATALVFASAIGACYGGDFLPPPDDGVAVPDPEAGADATANPDAAAPDVGPVPDAEAGAPCDGGVCTKYVFVTTATRPGDFGGFTAADATCAGAATSNTKLEGRTFRAWLSQGNVSPLMRFTPNGSERYVRLDEIVVADSFTSLVAGTLKFPINVDETGAKQLNREVWTATDPGGGDDGTDCGGWSSKSDTGLGQAGTTEHSDARWTKSVDLPCSQPAHFYCIED